jgi:hypothetical protein
LGLQGRLRVEAGFWRWVSEMLRNCEYQWEQPVVVATGWACVSCAFAAVFRVFWWQRLGEFSG